MNIIDIIVKKKNKEELTYDEIKFAINNYLDKKIEDMMNGLDTNILSLIRQLEKNRIKTSKNELKSALMRFIMINCHTTLVELLYH